MKRLSHTLLLASGLSLSGVGATEYDPFVLTNPAGYPTFSTILAVEEGGINAVLRREFAKGVRYRVGSYNTGLPVRVGDYLEGTFSVDHAGMTEFSFIVHEVGIDL